ncbi:hypothetical protein HELRODRAFT_176694 [Helobdella robusta]|uniref:Nucleotide-diphospho-sugar transferase domain-containing protein n=1 Tax=Helobdella robusta TaxID=6412 RepID=T1FAS6_HELRO|nr:hypothetical protein HELRODRAFT_176694 [Helobdella robusta]ESN99530.1 hypothetical protein HELRODRAFT_176694 [Helobdella robusta]
MTGNSYSGQYYRTAKKDLIMNLKRKKILYDHVHSSARTPHGSKKCYILCFVILTVYVLYELSANISIYDFIKRCPDPKLAVAIANQASVDKYIILAMVDSSFTDMALNLYWKSFRPNAIENFLFMGGDLKSCEILANESLPCYHYSTDETASVASVWNSPDFIRKMNLRTDMVLDALSLGYTVLHTDLDVMFFQNPLPELKVIMGEHDIASLWDNTVYNAGFICIKPTKYSLKVYNQMKQITDYSPQIDDQSALNKAISSVSRRYKNFKVKILDPNRFLCGLEYFENGNRLYPSPCQDCMVLHNNWIVSKEAKIYRFKEHLMWVYDQDEYYSSPTNMYMSYSNPSTWPNTNVTITYEMEALKGALAIARMLNRILILPRFHCSHQVPVNGKKDVKMTKRRIFRTVLKACPLNGLLNIKSFDSVFQESYRENSFLQNPAISEGLAKNRSKEIVIITVVNANLFRDKIPITSLSSNHVGAANKSNVRSVDETESQKLNDNHNVSDDIELIDMSKKQVIKEEDIKSALSSFTERVLVFRSLYQLMPQFTDEEDQRVFNADISKAFKKNLSVWLLTVRYANMLDLISCIETVYISFENTLVAVRFIIVRRLYETYWFSQGNDFRSIITISNTYMFRTPFAAILSAVYPVQIILHVE